MSRVCPRCHKVYNGYPALSRRDNVEICSQCGIEEALEDYEKNLEKYYEDNPQEDEFTKEVYKDENNQ